MQEIQQKYEMSIRNFNVKIWRHPKLISGWHPKYYARIKKTLKM